MKVKKLHIHNFKVFEDVVFEYHDIKALILCGRNGFGKTSIFDALELLFTGRIKRYENYGRNYHDQQLRLRRKQLVHDENIHEVYVEADVQLSDGSICKLKENAIIDQLTPPIDFENAFHKIGSYDNPEIDSFCKHYTRLNYLSQDESTEYLKRKEGDRSKQIETLFKTEIFDQQINKIDTALSSLRNVRDGYSEQRTKITTSIEAMNAKLASLNNNDKGTDNVLLFKPSTIDWDVDKPNLSPNGIDSLVQQDGALDDIIYYIDHHNEYQLYRRNVHIQKILQSDIVHKIAFYDKYKYKKNVIGQYLEYEKSYLRYYNNLSTDNLGKTPVPEVGSLISIISKEETDHIELWRTQAARTLASSTKIAQACNRLLENRHHILQELTVTDFSVCPVCGTNLESKDHLLKHIQDYEEVFQREALKAGDMSATVFSDFKEAYYEAIIKPFNKYFEAEGISKAICDEYEEIKDIASSDDYEFVITHVGNDFKDLSTLADMEISITGRLNSLIIKQNEKLDTVRLQQVFTRYGQFLKEGIRKEDIEKKRQYLLSYQRELCLKLSKKNDEELNKLNELISKCRKYDDNLLSIRNKIKKQRGDYLTKVIYDIQTLFYIYSGRIMQDSYYGRGIFLKRVVSEAGKSRILFVSGDYDNDLDVLYNMSSGQLISVAIAFLLALNKLYDNAGFLAIDDPVQTIDDINLWGLIETIRHEFANKSILLSTHEDDSAALIRYKLSMMGIKANALDMSTVHKARKEDSNDKL